MYAESISITDRSGHSVSWWKHQWMSPQQIFLFNKLWNIYQNNIVVTIARYRWLVSHIKFPNMCRSASKSIGLHHPRLKLGLVCTAKPLPQFDSVHSLLHFFSVSWWGFKCTWRYIIRSIHSQSMETVQYVHFSSFNLFHVKINLRLWHFTQIQTSRIGECWCTVHTHVMAAGLGQRRQT